MDVEKKQYELRASDGEALFCDIRHPSEGAGFPPIVFVHGFKGFKDWGFFPYVAESLARNGFYVVTFNFSHNGTEGHGEDFTRLDKFGKNTFSRELSEIDDVVTAVADGSLPDGNLARTDRIGLMGHSRGGGLVIVHAAEDSRIAAVAAWSPVGDFDRYSDRQKEEWREFGRLDIPNARTGQVMPLDVALLEDLEQNRTRLDVVRAAGQLSAPLLIVHGEVDLTVPIQNAESIAQNAKPRRCTLARISQTGHTFGAVHPFSATTDPLEGAISYTAQFFKERLAA